MLDDLIKIEVAQGWIALIAQLVKQHVQGIVLGLLFGNPRQPSHKAAKNL